MKNLYQVEIGDDVKVIALDKGINDILQCVKTNFDVLNGKYNSIELGQPIYGVASTISSQKVEIKNNKIYSSTVATALSQSASGIATGFKGSYISLLNTNPETGLSFDNDNYPNEIVIADSTDLKTANMWRWNKDGLMFQTGGWKSISSLEDVTIAITNDGKINADAILVGSLVAGTADIEGNPLLKISKNPNNPNLDSFLLNVKNAIGEQLIKVDSTHNQVIINATTITTGSLSIKNSNGDLVSIIPTISDGSGDNFYIDSNYIRLKNITADEIVAGSLTVRQERSGEVVETTLADLFTNYSAGNDAYKNRFAKVTDQTTVLPDGTIKQGKWYRSAATYEGSYNLGNENASWSKQDSATIGKYIRLTPVINDMEWPDTNVKGQFYIPGYTTVSYEVFKSYGAGEKPDKICSIQDGSSVGEINKHKLIIYDAELHEKTPSEIKAALSHIYIYYKMKPENEVLTYKWYPSDDYWYWTHFNTTYPENSVINEQTRIGSFYVSGNAIYQGMPGREWDFSPMVHFYQLVFQAHIQ